MWPPKLPIAALRSRTPSSASVTGEAITYAPLAHLPRSMMRQRSLQKGKSASVLFTFFLQIGQRSLTMRLLGMAGSIVVRAGKGERLLLQRGTRPGVKPSSLRNLR
jgi:hypothetical protein